MTVLVTGAAGFIGSHVCERLLDMNYKVIGIDNFDGFYSREIKERNLVFLKQNRDFAFHEIDLNHVDSVFYQNQIDTVIHLAALAGVRPSIERPLDYTDNNVSKTVFLLQNCIRHDVAHCVVASSSSVYGNIHSQPFYEHMTDLFPISPYGASKLSMEHMCRSLSLTKNINITALRYFTVYGPRQRPDLAIHKFTKAALLGEQIQMFGDGSTSRDYTYIDDIAEGTCMVALKPKHSGYNVYNIGNTNPIKLIDMIDTIYDVVGVEKNVLHMPDQIGDVRHTYASTRKIEEDFGWKPKISFDIGVRRFVEWAKEIYT